MYMDTYVCVRMEREIQGGWVCLGSLRILLCEGKWVGERVILFAVLVAGRSCDRVLMGLNN